MPECNAKENILNECHLS